MSYKFRLRTCFIATSIVAVLMAMFSYNFFVGYLGLIFTVASMTNYVSRFRCDRVQLIAGIHATLAGTLCGGVALATYFTGGVVDVSGVGGVTTLLGFWFGAAFGMMMALIPVTVFALMPRPIPEYMIPPPDFDAPSIEPYTDTQGF